MEKNKINSITSEGITIEGIGVLKRNIFADDRGFLIETFAGSKEEQPSVYAYSSLVQPGCAKDADKYHHHQKQSDRFTIVLGKMWVLLFDLRKNSSTYNRLEVVLLEGGNEEYKEKIIIPAYTITIPPGVYHGIKNPGLKPAILVNHPTCEYNSGDEGRTPFLEIPVPSLNNNNFSWGLVG